MGNLTTREILNKFAKELYSRGMRGTAHFDFSSYADIKDIPTLNINGDNVEVLTFKITKNGRKLTIISHNDKYSLDMDNLPETFTDDYFKEIGLHALFEKVYYESDFHNEEDDDYETDFLNN